MGVRNLGWIAHGFIGLLATGCYQWVRVPPPELAKLESGAFPATIATADGKVVDIEGPFAVKVTTRHNSFDFGSPISCTVTRERLQIGEVGAAPINFSRGDIERTDVYRHRKTLSRTVLIAGITLAVLGAYLFMLSGPLDGVHMPQR
jgi:hypothetical protein